MRRGEIRREYGDDEWEEMRRSYRERGGDEEGVTGMRRGYLDEEEERGDEEGL